MVAKFGSKIGSNPNQTELNTRFRFKVWRIAEPECEVRFGVWEGSVAFETEPKSEPGCPISIIFGVMLSLSGCKMGTYNSIMSLDTFLG